MHDNRKEPRFEENVIISFENATDEETLGSGIDEMPCLLTELSEGGARVRVPRPFAVGTPLLLHLVLEHDETEDEEAADDVYLQIHAETRWAPDTSTEPPFEIGLSFAPMPDSDLDVLRDYIAQKHAKLA